MNQEPPFDLSELRAFVAVAHHRSFTKAGTEVNLAQTSVSRSVANLEEKLGLLLLERTTRRVELTDAGRFFRPRAEALLEGAQNAYRSIHEGFQLGKQSLRIGISRMIGLGQFPGLIAAFRQKHPQVQLRVEHGSSDELLERVRSFSLDLAVVTRRAVLPQPLHELASFEDPFTLLTPGSGDDVAIPKRSLRALKSDEWILPHPSTETGRQLRHWLADLPLETDAIIDCDSFDLAVNLVGMGLGISLVPHRVVPLYLRTRELRTTRLQPVFSRTVALVARVESRGLTDLTVAFASELLFS